MALTLSAIRLLARAHARKPFSGPILTLGRQAVIATVEQCETAIRAAGLAPHPLPPDMARGPSVPAHQGGATARFTNDACLFWMLCGATVESLDVSDYEDADHIHDLNLPTPPALSARFGTVLDGGTLEHVFDVPQALRNMKALLRAGGRIIHMSPVSNWAEHGYYQFSPTLFHDFYVTNGFRMADCLLLAANTRSLEGYFNARMPAWRWTAERPSAPVVSRDLLTMFFEAEKLSDEADHVPQQGEAAARLSSSQLGGNVRPQAFLSRLRSNVLRTVPAAGGLVLLGKRLLGRDLSSKPWGLEYIGRF